MGDGGDDYLALKVAEDGTVEGFKARFTPQRVANDFFGDDDA